MKLAGRVEHTTRPFAGLRGTGRVTLRDGQVPSVKLNENLIKLLHFNNLGPAAKDPSSFLEITADLNLADQRISSNEISVIGYGVNAQASGTFNLTSGELDHRGRAEITTKQSFFTNLFARLSGVSVENGRLSFPFRLTGTIDAPKFSMVK